MNELALGLSDKAMKFNTSIRIILANLAIVMLASCSSGTKSTLPDISLPTLGLPDITHAKLPFVHRIDIQQGNVVTQEMIAQLKIGMDKKKIRYVMGTPIIRDTFNSDRWDYLFTEQQPGEDLQRRHIILYFENQLLSRVEGDITPALGRLVVDTRQDTTVDVPGVYEKGFFRKIKDSMPLIGEDGEELEGAKSDKDPAKVVAKAEEKIDEAEPELAANDEEAEVSSSEEIVVPENAPKKEKKRGFFKRIFDSVGLGADEDDEVEYDTADPRYRTPSPQDEL